VLSRKIKRNKPVAKVAAENWINEKARCILEILSNVTKCSVGSGSVAGRNMGGKSKQSCADIVHRNRNSNKVITFATK